MNKTKHRAKIFISTSFVTLLTSWHPPLSAQENAACKITNASNLRGTITFEPNCTYTQPIVINESNTEINCRGATLDGQHKLKIGIRIDSKGKPLNNVTIKNCTIINFDSLGILVTSGIPNYKRTEDRQKNYDITPTNVTLSNLNVENSGQVGVYLDSYVTNTTLKNSTILRSKGVGVYLEQSSRDNQITNNIIRENGEWNGPGSYQREGLAIDSSARNLIEGNEFIRNSAGGIYLYKNCGEMFSKGKSVLRWQSSNDNTIKNNRFTDEKTGVWVASRQSAKLADCGDPPLDPEGKYYQDYADHNTIENNVFCRNKNYIKVEGNYNTIKNNRSDATTKNLVSQPITMKERLTGVPTTGNQISNNIYQKCSD
ncbi:right-handed parallel beta-helix repeat-containing protein [Pseudomonas sp. Irchel 3H3]|uniref:right-handed parallel beta-helix repeat-containing protein n=1 Tax=Pseudomonas sp. Irchel 3H3 TaxID=2009038 RepID=UPI000BA2D531|nr:right-handed parallel beta-helix repeat-containing protein [Pseudomonas sp. Irchel 3H3]